MGSGNLPPSLAYISRRRRKRWPRIQLSSRTSLGAWLALYFHCAQRPELVNEPSFSIQWVVGRNRTSVATSAASIPGARQNSEPVVGSGSMMTSHFSLDSDCAMRFESGPTATPWKPP